MEIESKRYSGSHGRFTWLRGVDFEYEKAIHKIGAAFALVQPQFGRGFALNHHRERTLDSPQHSEDKTAVEIAG